MRFGFLLLTACLALSVLPAPAAHAAAPGLTWRAWDRGLEEARSTKRHVLVDVYTDWCGWCRRMEADVYSRPEVREYLARKFVLVKLDAEAADAASYEGRPFTSRSLAARFSVNGYPTTIFLKPEGDHLINVPGYVPADRFLLVLRYIGDGHLDRGETFQDFLKQTAPDAQH
jgi:thioredoxin-related protein